MHSAGGRWHACSCRCYCRALLLLETLLTGRRRPRLACWRRACLSCLQPANGGMKTKSVQPPAYSRPLPSFLSGLLCQVYYVCARSCHQHQEWVGCVVVLCWLRKFWEALGSFGRNEGCLQARAAPLCAGCTQKKHRKQHQINTRWW